MSQVLKVILSPFYPKEEYIDLATQIKFGQYRNSSEIVDLSYVEDLSGIRTAIRLNVLQIIEGGLPDEVRENSQPNQGSVSDGSRHEDSNDSLPATRLDQAREVIADEADQIEPDAELSEAKAEIKAEAKEEVKPQSPKSKKK